MYNSISLTSWTRNHLFERNETWVSIDSYFHTRDTSQHLPVLSNAELKPGDLRFEQNYLLQSFRIKSCCNDPPERILEISPETPALIVNIKTKIPFQGRFRVPNDNLICSIPLECLNTICRNKNLLPCSRINSH